MAKPINGTGKTSVRDFLQKPKEKQMLQVKMDRELLDAVKEAAKDQDVSLVELQEALYLYWLTDCGKPFRRKQS